MRLTVTFEIEVEEYPTPEGARQIERDVRQHLGAYDRLEWHSGEYGRAVVVAESISIKATGATQT